METERPEKSFWDSLSDQTKARLKKASLDAAKDPAYQAKVKDAIRRFDEHIAWGKSHFAKMGLLWPTTLEEIDLVARAVHFPPHLRRSGRYTLADVSLVAEKQIFRPQADVIRRRMLEMDQDYSPSEATDHTMVTACALDTADSTNDRAIQARRSSDYNELVNRVQAGKKGAALAAKKMFGRNAIARELRVRSAAMVSKSPVWQGIADALNLRKSKVTRGAKIGLDIAIEEKAQQDSVPVIDSAIRCETIEMIESRLPRAEAEPIVERLHRGDMTDSQARELVAILSESGK